MVLMAAQWLGLGCSTPPPVEAPVQWAVQEAFDVPPPPGFVSLDLGPRHTSAAFELGASVTLARNGHRVTADIVDVRQDAAGTVLTVYANADGATAWVQSAVPVTVGVLP